MDIKLSADEALVFFDWLARFEEPEATAYENTAERRVLWNIQAQLEKVLVEPFGEDYEKLVQAARQRILAGT